MDKTVRLWDLTTGRTVQTLIGHTDEVMAVVFSYNGSLLASASQDRTVRLWDPTTGRKLEGHTNEVTAVTFSHDGSLLASGSLDQTVRLCETITGREVQTFTGAGKKSHLRMCGIRTKVHMTQ
jgi:WD40 repeat protein